MLKTAFEGCRLSTVEFTFRRVAGVILQFYERLEKDVLRAVWRSFLIDSPCG
jgi:hypothetical protein